MAREERIALEVTADDDASRTLDRVADKAEDLERSDPEVAVTADDDASRVLEDVGAEARELAARDHEIALTARVGDLRAALATAEADLERVKGAAGGADEAVGKIGGSADQSGSVLANMVGNATQDLGALGGVAGSAGVAIGQLAEYAADGNIALQGLVKTAVPMLAIGIAVSMITSRLADAKKEAEELKKANEEIAASLREGKIGEAAAAIVEQYGDVIAAAEELGYTTAQVTDVITGQADALPGLTSRMADLAGTIDDGTGAWDAQGTAVGDEYNALRDLDAQLRTASGSLSEQSGILDVNARRLDDVSHALGGVDDAAGDVVDAFESLKSALDMEASYLDAIDNADTLAGSLADLAALQADATTSAEDLADAQRAVAGDTNSLQAEVVELVERYGEIPESERTQILAELPLAEQAAFGAFIDTVEAEHEAKIVATIDTTQAERDISKLKARWSHGWGSATPWAAPAATTTTVTVNMPRGARGSDVVRSVERYARRNGGGR